MKLRAYFCRVYFNRAADAPKVWSLDFGEDTVEITAVSVNINGAPCRTVFCADIAKVNGPSPDLHRPRAWFEFGEVEISIDGGLVTVSHVPVEVKTAPHLAIVGREAA